MNICNFPTQYGMDFAQGRRQRGGQWCPAPAFEICAPHFRFGPLVAAYIQYRILKIGPPLLLILNRLPTKFTGGNLGYFV